MMKIFISDAVVSRGYDGAPAIRLFNSENGGEFAVFQVGIRKYDSRAENNHRWVNLKVKAFGDLCERIKKMSLKEGSFISLCGDYDEERWTDKDTGEGRSAPVIVLDDIKFSHTGGQKKEQNGNGQDTGGQGQHGYQIEREYQELTQAMLKYNDPFWWLTVVFKEAGFTEVERNPNDVALSIELSYCNNYYEDMILELLNTLVPFTAEGFISYRGEKGDLWCHVFAGGEWTERSGRICYDEPRPQFEESKQNLERLIEEIRRQVIYDDRPYEDRARDLLKAFEAHDPDGVLLALSGRRLREHGVAAAIWQDGGESAHPDEGE